MIINNQTDTIVTVTESIWYEEVQVISLKMFQKEQPDNTVWHKTKKWAIFTYCGNYEGTTGNLFKKTNMVLSVQ
jgi:hypothetical protein